MRCRFSALRLLIVLIQAREQTFGRPGGYKLAAPRGLHCRDRFGIVHERLERQRLLRCDAYQQHAEGVELLAATVPV
jgi:hypothetical protein